MFDHCGPLTELNNKCISNNSTISFQGLSLILVRLFRGCQGDDWKEINKGPKFFGQALDCPFPLQMEVQG